MANLEALTSKLKMSFGDDAEPAKEENLQSQNDVNVDDKKLKKSKTPVV